MATISSSADAKPLFGRSAESDRIATLLDAARASQSAALVLTGEAGVGKSALLDRARVLADGMWILSSRGIEAEAQLPFAALHQLVRPALRHADAIPRVQAYRGGQTS